MPRKTVRLSSKGSFARPPMREPEPAEMAPSPEPEMAPSPEPAMEPRVNDRLRDRYAAEQRMRQQQHLEQRMRERSPQLPRRPAPPKTNPSMQDVMENARGGLGRGKMY